jgi:hypothetical protein
MILNNYFNFIGNTPRFSADVGGTSASADIGLIDTNGDSVSWQYSGGGSLDANPRIVNNFVQWREIGVALSADTSDPAASDYSVTDDITSDFTGFSVSVTSGADTGKATLTVTIGGTNASGAAVSIAQICLTKKVYTDAYNNAYKTVLFVKHKLDVPIELAAGESFTKTFAWNIS